MASQWFMVDITIVNGDINCLVVEPYPSEKYESQIGSSSQVLGKIKHVPNHQPDERSKTIGAKHDETYAKTRGCSQQEKGHNDITIILGTFEDQRQLNVRKSGITFGCSPIKILTWMLAISQ
jgi:hypothetical protein